MPPLIPSCRKLVRACVSSVAAAALLLSGIIVDPVSVSAQTAGSKPVIRQAAPRQAAPRPAQVQRQQVQRTPQSAARTVNRPSQQASRPSQQTQRPSQSSNARPSQNSSGSSAQIRPARPANQAASTNRQPVKKTAASQASSNTAAQNRPSAPAQPKLAVPKNGNAPLGKTGQALTPTGQPKIGTAPLGKTGQALTPATPGKGGLAPSNTPIKPVPSSNKLALPNAGNPIAPANKSSLAPPQAQIKTAPGAPGSSSLQGPFGKQIASQLGKGAQPIVKPSNLKPISAAGILPAKLPPVRPPFIAPQVRAAFVPASFGWHPWRGRNLFPYFFVGAIVAGGSYAAYNYWSAPVPSCYVGGYARYYYPGTRVCYDFAAAVDGDDFEVEGRVYRWQPTRYRTVETLIESEEASAEPSTGWVERQPVRAAAVQSSIQRAASRSQTLAALPQAKLDCSTCLSALGPTQGENNMCTVSVVNNCDHDVSVVGGLTRTSAAAGAPPLCDFTGDVAAGTEVVACNKPCDEFADAQVFLNTVVPAAGTPKPAPSCRPQQQQAQAQ